VLIAVNIFCLKSLDMIVFSEIQPGDLVKIFVNEDGVEDEMYGVVGMNTGSTLGIKYLNATESFYKSACVYKMNEEMLPAPYESVMEHYTGEATFEDIEMKRLGDDMYAYYSEIDIEDEDSYIYDQTDEDTDLEGFVVSDSEIDGNVSLPPDHELVDKEWNEWKPSSPGSLKFKELVNKIEERAKTQVDNVNF
jgi:hypothetical protein|tara:strand:- start:2310 stop:2888 length:579 start_codon:yes stop_codon:yes gene_type:complete